MNDLARSPKQIGNLIRCARRKKGLTQKGLGEMAARRQETISLIENGNPASRIDTLLQVLGVLDLEFQIAPRSKMVIRSSWLRPNASGRCVAEIRSNP